MDCDWRLPGLLTGLLMTLCLSSQLAIAQDVESPKDDIAAQIRAQGYACDHPQSATRDAQASKPDESLAAKRHGSYRRNSSTNWVKR